MKPGHFNSISDIIYSPYHLKMGELIFKNCATSDLNVQRCYEKGAEMEQIFS